MSEGICLRALQYGLGGERGRPSEGHAPSPPSPLQSWTVDLGEGVLGPKKSQKSLEKSLPGPGPKGLKKVSKKVRKVRNFRDFFRTFGAPGRETFSRLFRDFLALGPETPSPRSTEPQTQNQRVQGGLIIPDFPPPLVICHLSFSIIVTGEHWTGCPTKASTK